MLTKEELKNKTQSNIYKNIYSIYINQGDEMVILAQALKDMSINDINDIISFLSNKTFSNTIDAYIDILNDYSCKIRINKINRLKELIYEKTHRSSLPLYNL